MTVELCRAELVPFNEQGNEVDEGSKIVLDFNPETLTMRVQNALQDRPARRGRQRTQFVGSSTSTLSFDAYFDSTRPKNEPGQSPGQERAEDLDVRARTGRIAALLQVSDPNAQHPAPRRVQFRWGSVVFEGVVESYTEVLEYFSPEGVPLRAKISLSLKEQRFEYQTDPEQRAQLASFRGGAANGTGGGGGPRGVDDALGALGASISLAGEVAAQNGLDSLLELGASASLSFDASLSFEASLSLDASVSASASVDLGVGVDLAASAGASIDVSAGAALEVFGGAAIDAALGGGGGVDVSATARGSARAAAGPVSSGPRAAWAPAGPAPGSRASALAAIVHAERASGAAPDVAEPARGAFSATALPSRTGGASVPVRGSPPRATTRSGAGPSGAVFEKERFRPTSERSLSGGRPKWEGLEDQGGASTAKPCCAACGRAAAASAGARPCGCGGGRW